MKPIISRSAIVDWSLIFSIWHDLNEHGLARFELSWQPSFLPDEL